MIENTDSEQLERANDRIIELLREKEMLVKALEPCARFVMWALMEGSWQGADIDGGSAQDKAQGLGLIIETQYDPEKHGKDDYTEPGESWFVASESLLAALQAVAEIPTGRFRK